MGRLKLVLALFLLHPYSLFPQSFTTDDGKFGELETIKTYPLTVNCFQGHGQGLTVNSDKFYVSTTYTLVKYDTNGVYQDSVSSGGLHFGDIEFKDDTIFVAVEAGTFNSRTPANTSKVVAYSATTLDSLTEWTINETVYGIGFIVRHAGQWVLGGGLYEEQDSNKVWIYNDNFVLQDSVMLSGGYTYLGLQTAESYAGDIYFGAYATPSFDYGLGKLWRYDSSWTLLDKYNNINWVQFGFSFVKSSVFYAVVSGNCGTSGNSIEVKKFRLKEILR